MQKIMETKDSVGGSNVVDGNGLLRVEINKIKDIVVVIKVFSGQMKVCAGWADFTLRGLDGVIITMPHTPNQIINHTGGTTTTTTTDGGITTTNMYGGEAIIVLGGANATITLPQGSTINLVKGASIKLSSAPLKEICRYDGVTIEEKEDVTTKRVTSTDDAPPFFESLPDLDVLDELDASGALGLLGTNGAVK